MRVLRCTLIAVSALIAAPASAETLGDARVGFSAERVLVIDGQSYVGRMWHMPGEQRHEQDLPALKPIFILHAGSAIGDIIRRICASKRTVDSRRPRPVAQTCRAGDSQRHRDDEIRGG